MHVPVHNSSRAECGSGWRSSEDMRSVISAPAPTPPPPRRGRLTPNQQRAFKNQAGITVVAPGGAIIHHSDDQASM